ncbi:GntP family permease [Bosea sp. 117]|uniref:GntT/GntP/DsdX family permease n=1 Tax=Bosea sp. 117 TaxID=1125973 RepID=UPI000494D9EA|nr:GntP family permease [Bosea sp. 117]
MSLIQAAWLFAALVLFVIATARGHVNAFLALIVASAFFGFGAGMATSQVGKSFGIGFSQTLQSLGLVVVAGALMAAIADGTGATSWLQARARGWRRRSLPLALVGLLGGLGASPAAAFAVLTPLRRAISGDSPRGALTLGLALSASHGLILPAPVMIAAVTILGADWGHALTFGVPALVLPFLIGVVFAHFAADTDAPAPEPFAGAADADSYHAPRRGAFALVLVTLVLLGFLITASLGDIASEPFGGGSNREFLLAFGRPLILLLAGTGLLLLLSWHWQRGGLADEGWAGQALARAAVLVLVIGAAGGLQKLIQDTGLPEMNAERLLGWQPMPALALVLPFALAAVMKTLQGSSLVAAITAAGMTAPLLGGLGLDDEAGRALAALAVGAGAMTVPHINDGLFWLVTVGGRMTPPSGLARFSLGAALQGAGALAALSLLRALAG